MPREVAVVVVVSANGDGGDTSTIAKGLGFGFREAKGALNPTKPLTFLTPKVYPSIILAFSGFRV